MVAERTGQYYFRPNPAGTALELFPIPTEPEPTNFSKLTASMINLNYLIESIDVSDNDDPTFDKVIRHWFASKFGPQKNLEIIWVEFIRPQPGYWSTKINEAQWGPVYLEDLTENCIKRFAEFGKVNLYQTMLQVDDAIKLLRNIACDLTNVEYRKNSEKTDWPGRRHPFLPLDKTLHKRFLKQLALVGIWTHSQLDYLTPEQIEEIKKIRIQPQFDLPDSLEGLNDLLEELGATDKSLHHPSIFYFKT